MKTFKIHFRHRDNGPRELDDAFETGQAKSKAAAVRWGKAIAKERQWWFIDAWLIDATKFSKTTCATSPASYRQGEQHGKQIRQSSRAKLRVYL